MEKNPNEIALTDITKSVTIGELEAVIAVLKSRQHFFEELVRENEKFADKAIAKLQEVEGNMPEEIIEKLKLLSNSFAKEMNTKIVKDFKDELDAQPEVNEFLLRFTGEKQVNYKSILIDNTENNSIK